jgi:hypothetical protein
MARNKLEALEVEVTTLKCILDETEFVGVGWIHLTQNITQY